MKKYLWICCALFFPLLTQAQIRTNSSCRFIPGQGEDEIKCGPNCQTSVIVKTDLLGPLQPQHIARLGVEIPLDSQLTIQPTVGYIYRYAYDKERLDMAKPSFEVRLDMKYYFRGKVPVGLYTGPMLVYRQTHVEVSERTSYLVYDPVKRRDILLFDYDYTNPERIKQSDYDFLWQMGLQPLFMNKIALNVFGAIGFKLSQFEHRRSAMDAERGIPPINRDYMKFGFAAIYGVQLGYAF